MNNNFTKIYIPFFLILLFIRLDAQNYFVPEQKITHANGLSDDSVTCFEQDSLGYLWIGTTKGLNRYNGSEFLHWTMEDSLKSDWILSLEFDQKNNLLWIGTSEGLNVMDLDAFEILDFSVDRNSHFDINTSWITGLIQIENNEVWIYNAGLCKLEIQSGKVELFLGPNNEKSNLITVAIQDHYDENILWCGTANGLAKFDTQSKKFIEHYFYEHQNEYVEANINLIELFIFQDRLGKIYAGCLNSGMFIYDPKNESVTSFHQHFKGIEFSDKVAYRQITALNENQILIYTNLGILLYDIITESIINFHKTSDFDSKTFAPSVVDSNKKFWISKVKGLNVYQFGKNRYQTHHLDKNLIGQNFKIKSLLEDSTQQILYFLKEVGHEVYKYDLKTNQLMQSLDKFKAGENFKKTSIVTADILLSKQHGLLLLCSDKMYTLENNLWVGTEILSSLEMLPYSDMELLGDHKLIVSSIYEGVHIYNYAQNKHINIPTDSLIGDGYWAFDIFKDNSNGFIVSQLGRGIIHFDEKMNEKYRIGFMDNINSQGHFSIKDLHFLNDDEYLVCGASNGVLKLDHTSKIEKLEFGEEFNVYAFESDAQNNIWMLSSTGLIKTNTDLDSFLFYNYPDPSFNLTTDLSQKHVLISLSDERMVFAGNQSICFFDPLSMSSETEKSRPIINSIATNDEVYSRSQVLKKNEFSHKENNMLFDFHHINYAANFNPEFKYMLEGVDEKWNYTKTIKQVKYGNLAPGAYTFKLNAANRDRVWFPTVDQLSFVILAPWWKTPWAFLLYILTLSFLFFWWYNYQKQKWNLQADLRLAHEKNARLELQRKASIMNALLDGAEGERQKLSRELHDGVGALMASAGMFIESLGNKFSMLQDESSYQRSKSLVKESYDEVRLLSHQLMPISLRNLGFKIAIESLLDDLNKASKLRTKCDLNIPDRALDEHTELHVYRIIQELVKNMIQHAEAKRIGIKMEISDEQLLIHLQNDGIKFNLEEGLKKNGLGLKNIIHRLDLLNGKITGIKDLDFSNNYLIQIPVRKI